MDGSQKENMSNTTSAFNASFIKPEPHEPKLAASPLSRSSAWQSTEDIKGVIGVKPEPLDASGHLESNDQSPEFSDPSSSNLTLLAAKQEEDAVNRGAVGAQYAVTSSKPSGTLYKIYRASDDIEYAPELALKEGLGMVKAIKANIEKVELGNRMRKDVWDREVQSLEKQSCPSTMIAVCGATGAGKSSILNAILDDNIVPTSGMRACTAVVTEIGYHTKKTIDADVSFLSAKEWRDELAVLLTDLVDEDGNLRRSTDLRSDAGIAWQKVHAVYPSATQEQLVKMTVDEIIDIDPRVANILGTTKKISALDSKTFAKDIGKYIDSKDQKRGEKKSKKDKEKAKASEPQSKGKSILAKFSATHNPASKSKKTDDNDPDGAAFWPLIRQVNVRCNAPALSTGALLVDLPGVADANAARNNIAKDYMKKCDCIWILAPITRAVDDKTARDLMGDAFKMQLMMDGNYDAHAITFIATKCDDISCTEVVRALNLEDEEELEKLEDEISECMSDMTTAKAAKAEAEAIAKDVEASLKTIRPLLSEYKDHLKALQNGESFTPFLTAKKPQDPSTANSKKRKNASGSKQGSPKRRKGSEDSDDDAMVIEDLIDDDDMEDLTFSDDDDEPVSVHGSESEADKSDDDKEEDDEDKEGSDEGEEEEDEEVTEESLKIKIAEAEEAIKVGRVQISEQRKLRKEAMDKLAVLKKRESKAQREKNAFCSLRRSEFSRDVLKEDFRVGLKDLDDAAAEQRNPDTFDPTQNIRDYDAIDLPVFTVSARDYVRIKGQVKGDGEPTCFTNVADTGVPELQNWCHQLTVASRERAARNFLTHLKTFANTVRIYVQGVGDVTAYDRALLREKWESCMPDDEPAYDDNDANVGTLGGLNLAGLVDSVIQATDRIYTMPVAKAAKVDRTGNPIGVTPRLIKDFQRVALNCVKELQARFKDGLDEKCRTGAATAASSAVPTADNFAASMHWATYRATLRRHGAWRQDLNVELSGPFTRNIASSWSKVFEADLFASFERAANNAIIQLIKEVESSCPVGLKERARQQGEMSLEEAKVALNKTVQVVRDTMNTEQKEVSRSLSPHVQRQLIEGYDRAMEERGTGSVARQKALFRNFVDRIKFDMFEGAADVIMERLTKAAEAVGEALTEALAELAEKVEVSIAVLWEGPRDDPSQVKARQAVIGNMNEIIEQAQIWLQAAQDKKSAEEANEIDISDD